MLLENQTLSIDALSESGSGSGAPIGSRGALSPPSSSAAGRITRAEETPVWLGSYDCSGSALTSEPPQLPVSGLSHR